MKTYCKNVDITDRALISRAVYDCLDDKYTRGDTLRLFEEHSDLTKEQILSIYQRANQVGEASGWQVNGKSALRFIVEKIIDDLEWNLLFQTLEFKPIRYEDRRDSSSGKMRRIGIQDVYQQICDYIAAYALEPLFKRIGECQCASIKGRGQIYGVKRIKKWIQSSKYFGKADVRHCFESINIDILLNWMRKRVKNEPLMWLVETLLRTFEQGLSIGSYLSQHLCNLFMSIIYHYMAEDDDLFYERDGKKIHFFNHQVFYMDDIFLCGNNKSKLKSAFKLLCKKAKEIGLEIKPTWFVWDVEQVKFVDMMGIKIYIDHTEVRKKVWKRIRRCMIKLNKLIDTHKAIPINLARKFLSYYGLLKNTNSGSVIYRYNVKRLLRVTKGVVRNESKNRCKARRCSVSACGTAGICAPISA